MKKTISILLAAVILIAVLTATPLSVGARGTKMAQTGATSGTTGMCKWSFDPDTAVLTISGSGEMEDYDDEYEEDIDNFILSCYDFNPAPWRELGVGKVIIKNSVTRIGENAFYDCITITSASIAASVTSIGSGAFSGCENLADIAFSGNIPRIGSNAFADTAWLRAQPDGLVLAANTVYCIKGDCPADLVIDEGVTGVADSAFAGRGITSVTIPDTVTVIGDGAFRKCAHLTSVTIPDSVTSVGYSAFRGCSSLESAVIGAAVQAIHASAFESCTSLKRIGIGRSVERIEDAFRFCTSLSGVYISDLAAWCGINFTDLSSNPLCYAHKLYLNGALVTDAVIPASVKSISNSAFYCCTSLKSISIPDSVTALQNYSFSDCTSLTTVSLPDTLTLIGHNAFRNCDSLTGIDIPGAVTYIGWYAFTNCRSLTRVSIPESVSQLGIYAFSGCSSLTSADIRACVTDIPLDAFNGCTSLARVNIPDSVTSISADAFYGCDALKKITIPASVRSIGNRAFGYNSASKPITGFTVRGYRNSAAEDYAKANGFAFAAVIIRGDADGDTAVSVNDAAAIQRHLVRIPEELFVAKAADTDGDGTVTILDATAVQRWLADLPTKAQDIGTVIG